MRGGEQKTNETKIKIKMKYTQQYEEALIL